MFYVAPNGNDAWSGQVADATDSDGPFKTLERAQEAVRTLIADGMDDDVEVQLRGGDYYLEQPLVFDERDSGRDGYRVIYRNYRDEVPVIYGGRGISGWEPYQGDIYRAEVRPDWVFFTMTENGVRSFKARHPNQGYNEARVVNDHISRRQFGYSEGDVPTLTDISALQAFIWPGGPDGHWNWFSDIIPVLQLDAERQVITLKSETRYDLGEGSRYYLQGALELLDEPGEFYLDSAAGMLYYWPRQTPIEAQVITAPLMSHIVQFSGSSPESPVHDITLNGLEIVGSDFVDTFVSARGGQTGDNTYTGEDGMVYLENAQNIAIRNSHLHSAGLHAVYINGWAQDNAVENNWIHDIGFSGVLLNGPWMGHEIINRGNQIVNNHIHDTGQLVGHGTGIQIVQSAENRIAYNLIHDTSRYAISLKSPRPGSLLGQRADGVSINESNVLDYNLTRDNVIEFNDVSRANLDSQDTGVVEAWGVANPGNSIRNNLIHDSNIPFSFGFGVYMDDASNGFEITNNIIYDLQLSGGGTLRSVFMIKGIGSRIANNVAALNFAGSGVETFEMAGEANRDLTFENNIFYLSGDTAYTFINWDDARLAASEDNLFYNANRTYRVEVRQRETYDGIPAQSLSQWQQVLDGRYDQETITDDPQFIDVQTRDLRLQPDSPAYDLGFKDIDVARIGLTSAFPYDDPNDPIDRLYLSSDQSGYLPTLRLAVGDEAQLGLTGRTVMGYVASLVGATIYFDTSDEQVATVNELGQVQATGTGEGLVTAQVSKDGVEKTARLFVVVE
ncbi:MAG: right-handed parallel beta-helix repeat-containing protein [Anaerolineae bacterium]|nr:right-handed parallel beta-helix repeat-containing protein [Anaerolineae bacterium]